MLLKKITLVWLLLYSAGYVFSQNCADYQTITLNNPPDECATATDLVPAFDQCRKICVDLTNATASNPAPSCGTAPHKDIWFKIHNPYAEFSNYDGSVVLAWKQLPDPAHNPTIATYAAVQGDVKLGFITVATLDDVCGDAGFQSVSCTNDSLPDTGNQLILPPGSIPTQQQLEDMVNASPDITGAGLVVNVTDYSFWFQLENYQSTGGVICFEISSYQPGFSCSDPTELNFANTGTPQTQTINRCLCKSAQNGGYYNATNTPCTVGSNYNSTTAFYQLNLPYSCNDVSFALNAWNGSGNVNVSLLSNVQCPDVMIDTTTVPGQKVTTADVVVGNCLTVGSSLSAECLPAGTYYLLVSGADDKAVFSGGITVSEGTPPPSPGVKLLANLLLEGAYNGTGMNTTLRTANLLPIAQPFNTSPFDYNGTEVVANAAAIPANAVDWVLIELHDAANPALVTDRRAAFVDASGNIIDTDGSMGVQFYGIAAATNHYLVARSRNHLAVVSRLAQTLPNAIAFSFNTPANIQSGSNQLNQVGSTYVLKAGDINADGVINYTDFNQYIAQQGSNVYNRADLNLDGSITNSDFNLFQQNAAAIAVPDVR